MNHWDTKAVGHTPRPLTSNENHYRLYTKSKVLSQRYMQGVSTTRAKTTPELSVFQYGPRAPPPYLAIVELPHYFSDYCQHDRFQPQVPPCLNFKTWFRFKENLHRQIYIYFAYR